MTKKVETKPLDIELLMEAALASHQAVLDIVCPPGTFALWGLVALVAPFWFILMGRLL